MGLYHRLQVLQHCSLDEGEARIDEANPVLKVNAINETLCVRFAPKETLQDSTYVQVSLTNEIVSLPPSKIHQK